jgi:hypothetical protein
MPEKSSVFTSPEITKEAVKAFGTETHTTKVQMKYTREIKSFISKMEIAHKRTAKSKLVFKH